MHDCMGGLQPRCCSEDVWDLLSCPVRELFVAAHVLIRNHGLMIDSCKSQTLSSTKDGAQRKAVEPSKLCASRGRL